MVEALVQKYRIDLAVVGAHGGNKFQRLVLGLDMAELWLVDSAKQMRLIQSGLELGDATMIQRAAHALKGSVGTFLASAAQEAANKLELSAKSGDMAGARKVFEMLSTQIDMVKQYLRQLAGAPSVDRGFKTY